MNVIWCCFYGQLLSCWQEIGCHCRVNAGVIIASAATFTSDTCSISASVRIASKTPVNRNLCCFKEISSIFSYNKQILCFSHRLIILLGEKHAFSSILVQNLKSDPTNLHFINQLTSSFFLNFPESFVALIVGYFFSLCPIQNFLPIDSKYSRCCCHCPSIILQNTALFSGSLSIQPSQWRYFI